MYRYIMQFEHKGEWLYIYDDRGEFARDELDDPFGIVTALRIKHISGFKHDTLDNTLSIYCKGVPHPIIYQLEKTMTITSNIPSCIQVLEKALGFDPEKVNVLSCRTEETSKAHPRWKDMLEALQQMDIEDELQPHELKQVQMIKEKCKKLEQEYKQTVDSLNYIMDLYKKIHRCESELQGYKPIPFGFDISGEDAQKDSPSLQPQQQSQQQQDHIMESS